MAIINKVYIIPTLSKIEYFRTTLHFSAKIRHLDKLLTISTFYRNPFPVANRRRFDKAFIRLR